MFSEKIKQYFFANTEFLVTSAFMLACLFLFLIFPSQGAFQGLSKGLFFLVVTPSLYAKIVLKKPLTDFGLNVQNTRTGLLGSFFVLVFSILIFYLALTYTDFKNSYGLPGYLTSNFWLFLAYELILVNFLVFIYFFFFQGFLLFGLSDKISHWAVLAGLILFSIFIFLSGNFKWQFFPVLVIFFAGGIVTYKTKSFVYAYATGIVTLLILDSYLIYTLNIK